MLVFKIVRIVVRMLLLLIVEAALPQDQSEGGEGEEGGGQHDGGQQGHGGGQQGHGGGQNGYTGLTDTYQEQSNWEIRVYYGCTQIQSNQF